MTHFRRPSRAALLGAGVLLALAACDGGRQAPITGAPAAGALRTPADSAAALRRNLALWNSGARGSLSAAAAGIPVQAGQRLVITVTGAESSRCEDVSVTGAINELVLHEVGGCYGNPNYGIGKTATTSAAAADGTVDVIMSTGAGGTGLSQISGSYPDYTVALDDGLYDADYNDVVLSVHVEGGSKLKVECTAVTRGESTTCTASAPGGTAFTVTGWTFEAQGHVVPRTSSVSQKTWGGEMAVGGTMTVTATMAGRTETATTEVVVNARQWPDRIPAVTESSPDCATFSEDCPVVYPPTASGHLGKASLFWQANGRATHITRGPNAGFSYVLPKGNSDVVITFPRRVTFLNPVLFRANDPWYAGRPSCTQQGLLDWVRGHEAVHQAAFTRNADGRINAVLEGFVRFASAHELTQALAGELAPGGSVSQAVLLAGDAAHTDPAFGPAPCAWNLINGEG